VKGTVLRCGGKEGKRRGGGAAFQYHYALRPHITVKAPVNATEKKAYKKQVSRLPEIGKRDGCKKVLTLMPNKLTKCACMQALQSRTRSTNGEKLGHRSYPNTSRSSEKAPTDDLPE
jgi:hypothetical protein